LVRGGSPPDRLLAIQMSFPQAGQPRAWRAVRRARAASENQPLCVHLRPGV